MTETLEERLRAKAEQISEWPRETLYTEAADEIASLRARVEAMEQDLDLWKREAANRSQGMVNLNLDRAAMGVENMQLREALAEAYRKGAEDQACLLEAAYKEGYFAGTRVPDIENVTAAFLHSAVARSSRSRMGLVEDM